MIFPVQRFAAPVFFSQTEFASLFEADVLSYSGHCKWGNPMPRKYLRIWRRCACDTFAQYKTKPPTPMRWGL